MEKSVVWFSHKENKYDAELKLFQKYFYWTNESQIWNWTENKGLKQLARKDGQADGGN